jgi:hypothetical protein
MIFALSDQGVFEDFQIAKSLKARASPINQQFFDPSI